MTFSFGLAPRYNIAPSQPVMALARREGRVQLGHYSWGFLPSWLKTLPPGGGPINARSETAHEKPYFKAAFRHGRCLVPATGFYEWRRRGKIKQPCYFHPAQGGLMAFAALWESCHLPDGSLVEGLALLTTQANSLMAPIHDRMPVVIPPGYFSAWLSPTSRPEEARSMLRPPPDNFLAFHPVSPMVNNPGQEGAGCVQPV